MSVKKLCNPRDTGTVLINHDYLLILRNGYIAQLSDDLTLQNYFRLFRFRII